MESYSTAIANRSLSTIRTELDFLRDCNVLTSSQINQIAAILPKTASSASTSNGDTAAAQTTTTAAAAPPQPSPSPNPPSYTAQTPQQQQPSGIATVSALYAYQPTDPGDLGLAVGERVTVLEWMNADWARGRSVRTGAEGIFPRSYAKVVDDEKAGWQQQRQWQQAVPFHLNQGPPMAQQQGAGYGNMPVDVAQGGPPPPPPNQQQQSQPHESKFNDQGKKFGRKLGNAAIFGAGASIGSNIVNGIL